MLLFLLTFLFTDVGVDHDTDADGDGGVPACQFLYKYQVMCQCDHQSCDHHDPLHPLHHPPHHHPGPLSPPAGLPAREASLPRLVLQAVQPQLSLNG